jgi:hypothetical protein
MINSCKYDKSKFCTPDCDREHCEFRGSEDKFWNKGEHPRMLKHKPNIKKIKR